MQQFADTRPFSDSASHSRKARQQIHVVKQSIAKTRSRFIVVFGNVADDLGEIL
jgi:hypothetical protein